MSETNTSSDVIERARAAALLAYEIEGEKFLANPTGEPQLQFVTEAADAAVRMVLEHLRDLEMPPDLVADEIERLLGEVSAR